MDYTPLLRLYAQRRRAILEKQDALAEQEQQLTRLIERAKGTRFGRLHDFSFIRTSADFQAAVPLRTYDQFHSEFWSAGFPELVDVTWPGRIPYFALSSGTSTAKSKYIPVTHAMNRSNRRASLDVLVHHVAHRQDSHILGGRIFLLGGSTDLTECATGVYSGDLSGIAVKSSPYWARRFAFPSPSVALTKDWEKKVEYLAAMAPQEDIRAISGTPSWLLLLFDRQLRGTVSGGARELYPNLELLIHGGVNFKPYRQRFENFLAGTSTELREVYPASEGFIAVQDKGPEDGLRLIVDNGLFFEFVPVDELGSSRPVRHTLSNVEPGVNYALIVSSCAGCWAYIVGDTVRFASRAPHRIMVTGRISYAMSAFGEHLIGEEVEDAVAASAALIGNTVVDFAMGARFSSSPGTPGGHVYVIEFSSDISRDAHDRFVSALDDHLGAHNDDYREHRARGFGMSAPEMLAVPSGTFAAWMKSRGRLGGQNKVPRIINDAALFDDLLVFARKQCDRTS